MGVTLEESHFLACYSQAEGTKVSDIMAHKLRHGEMDVHREFSLRAFDKFGDRVLSGPFAGMKISPHTAWYDGNLVSKLLGDYEAELHACMLQAIARNPRLVVNVGCAEGYYAVGLACLLPQASIRALDTITESLQQATQNAAANGVQNVSFWLVEGEFYNMIELAAMQYEADLIVMDCEAGEKAYLHADLQGIFTNCDIIVECHDFMSKGISDDLRQRFEETHRIDVIRFAEPERHFFEQFDLLGQSMPYIAYRDFHSDETIWLAMWSKARDQALSA